MTWLEKIVPASTITKLTEEYVSARDAVLTRPTNLIGLIIKVLSM
jgi:hypothetical protein